MIDQPFTLFAPFSDRLRISMFSRSDNLRTDEDVKKVLLYESRASKKRFQEKKASLESGSSTRGTQIHEWPTDIVSLSQKHGNRAVIVREPSSRILEADGLLTDVRNLVLTIRSADCQNFLVYAPEKHVFGLMHVGWRGLDAGMIPSFFEALETEWGVKPSETFVAGGPSLCMECADFDDPLQELPNIDARFKDAHHVDLQAAATAQLFERGIHPDRFERMPGCTRCDSQMWWTYRGGHHDEVKNGYTNVLAAALR